MDVLKKVKTLQNGHKIPMLGLGTWNAETNPKAGDIQQAVKAAISCGYRHIDCAKLYRNEEEVGAAIRECISEGIVGREELFVTSKLWNTEHLPSDVKPSLQETLSRLKLSYLDLYLVHWPQAYKPGKELYPKDEEGNVIQADIPLLDTWKALEKCVDDGLVKSIGVSNFNSKQVQEILDNARIKPVMNQVEIHPYLNNDKLVKFCQARGVTMTAYSPFCSPGRPWATSEMPVLLNDPQLKAIADKCGKAPSQVVLRWLIQRDIVAVPKSANPARIQSNIQIGGFQLDDEDMSIINGLDRGLRVVEMNNGVEDGYAVKDGKTVYTDRHMRNYPFKPEVEF